MALSGVPILRPPANALGGGLALHHAPPGVASNSTLPDISGLHRPVIALASALHQFNADTVWRGDVTQAAPVDACFQLDRETDAFAGQLGTKCLEIALVEEAEMIGPPCVMTGKIFKWPNASGGGGVLAGRGPRIRIVMPPRLTKICGAPRAVVFAVIVAPNISTYQLAEASGSLLMM